LTALDFAVVALSGLAVVRRDGLQALGVTPILFVGLIVAILAGCWTLRKGARRSAQTEALKARSK
jgi:hypothetical protein